jgi:hypothetical protein
MVAKVMITGASGFIAGHCKIEMLNHACNVRDPLESSAGHVEFSDLIILISLDYPKRDAKWCVYLTFMKLRPSI